MALEDRNVKEINKIMEIKGTVRAVCISRERGTEKIPVGEAKLVENYGIDGDAHAGNWHRQVSLLSYDKVAAFNERGAMVKDGDFGENLVVEGIDFSTLPVGTTLHTGGAVLEMSQIGKECHSHCTIYRRMGECIMPREGVFAKVIKGGTICPGDEIRAVLPEKERPFTAAVITLSDKGAKGEREDMSGPEAVRILEENGFVVEEQFLLPDEPELLKKELIRLADSRQINLVVTSGGTGFSHRDRTPEATMEAADRNAPGIAEAIRYESFKITKRAMLSRGVSVIRKRTLIVNLPGSPKAVKEGLEAVIGVLPHGLGVLRGTETECGSGAAGGQHGGTETKE